MKPSTGCNKSQYDIRTFSYPVKGYTKQSGGERYKPEDIESQSKVGICTGIHLTQNAKKALGKPFSADFQYLVQKLEYDKNWYEGSSILCALKVAKNIGLLPAEEWTFTKQEDRDKGYEWYVSKLKLIPQSEIDRLKIIAGNYKIKAYANIPVTRDSMAEAIDNSKAGILSMKLVGNEWWTNSSGIVTWAKEFIQPLRAPRTVVSGHAMIDSNYDGYSFRIANTWGKEWCDGGTAYYNLKDYKPVECWAVFYNELPNEIEKKLKERESIKGQILDHIQKIVILLGKL
jgi:hypothetical protein